MGRWNPVPVEYKRGTEKEGQEDEVQLCAQAICLEEMLLTEIPKGYLYYGENRRRTEVCFSEDLRNLVRNTANQMHEIYEKGVTPKVKTSKKCQACAERKILLSFYTPRGRFLARTTGMSAGNILLRKEQYRISDDESRSLPYAKNMILGKVFNCRWCLERTLRDYSMRLDGERMKQVSGEMQRGLDNIRNCSSLETLRGIEGEMASRYFSVFNQMVLNQKDDFMFQGRNRRPPQDNLNALLSFAYSILGNECSSALEGVGLNAYAGFLHQDRPGRQSLALDLMEELRAVMADRFVLSLVNRKMVQANHFNRQGDGAVLMNEEGRKIFLSAWQQRKKETLTHPFLGEKIPWGLVPHVQSMLLARTVRGDLDEYPPFLWK